MNMPPLEKFRKMEKKAHALHHDRKIENGTEKNYTIFKLEELEDGKMKHFEKFGDIVKFFSNIWKRPGTALELPKRYKEPMAERYAPRTRTSHPDNIDDVKKCTKVIQWKQEGLYVSEYWPWFLMDADLKKPFWKLMHNAMGYKKLTITSMICDLDIKSYMELKMLRDEELLKMQEEISLFVVPDVRGL